MSECGAVRIPAYIKQFWLGVWYDQAIAAIPPLTLLAKLKAVRSDMAAATIAGQSILSTSADAQTTQFSAPSLATGLGPQGMAYLVQELVNKYNESKSELIAEGTPAPTDAQIYDRMQDCLSPAKEVRNSYVNLRTANADTVQ